MNETYYGMRFLDLLYRKTPLFLLSPVDEN